MIRFLYKLFNVPVVALTRWWGSTKARIEVNDHGRPMRRRDLAQFDPRLPRSERKRLAREAKKRG